MTEPRRVVLFAALAYAWSLVDDNPVNADMLLGERGHPVMEAALHLLTAAFVYLAVRDSFPGRGKPRWTGRVLALAALALLAVWFDDVVSPFGALQALRADSGYPMDVLEHAVSLILLYLAIRAAMSPRGDEPPEENGSAISRNEP